MIRFGMNIVDIFQNSYNRDDSWLAKDSLLYATRPYYGIARSFFTRAQRVWTDRIRPHPWEFIQVLAIQVPIFLGSLSRLSHLS
jgi:hypothetical protein